ncbi:putative D-xylulose reductase A [Mycena sanguinolenta]|uniref:Putative D-xylulose reductase A n=1 Tax=Mycena sanguinolenta TaxID=230812 RepID=A0A8H6YBL9_9AGAR|nr:putative D-xylulose reductase A [Mycena sanguinolenta]
MTDNPSFVLKAIEEVVYEQRPIPEISGNQVLVEVKKTGICGSDVHYLVHGRIGDFVVNNPMVLGHESAGIVSKVGPDVKHLKVGDRVAVEPGATCGACDACKLGRYNLCPDIVFAATPPYDGTLGRFYRVPAHLAYPLPDGVSLEDGAMMEPLAVGVHSVSNLGGFRANQSIAVFGCGPVGLLCMAVAKALGASRIIAVDIVPARLEFAKEYAATDTYIPIPANEGESKLDYSKRNADAMKQQLHIEDRGANAIDLVIDASGAEVSIQTAFYVVKTGGTFVQARGHGKPECDGQSWHAHGQRTELQRLVPLRRNPETIRLPSASSRGVRSTSSRLLLIDSPSMTPLLRSKRPRAGKSEDGKGVIKAIISGPDVSIEEN